MSQTQKFVGENGAAFVLELPVASEPHRIAIEAGRLIPVDEPQDQDEQPKPTRRKRAAHAPSDD